MDAMNRLVGAVLAVGVILGMKFWNKQSAYKETKARLVSLCEGDAACVSSVGRDFDACFESAYSMGGKRQGGKLGAENLVRCLNQKSGEQYFAVTASN
jgi:hypothetical protein